MEFKTLKPKNKEELTQFIKEAIEKNGHNCDLNHIDTSLITDMSHLFSYGRFPHGFFSNFTGDISKWNTSNVKDMNNMFQNSQFNGDISQWDTSSVTNMFLMFSYSKFNWDISNWNTSSVSNMYSLFYNSQFNQDISLGFTENKKLTAMFTN